MSESLSLSIVVPVYNEAEALGPLYEELQAVLREAHCPWYEILFVDDGSEDGSFEICRGFHESDPEHVRVFRLRRNFGQTAAMAAGFDHARGDLLIPIDGDGQNDPHAIHELLAKAEEGYDVVSGWRKRRMDPFLTRKLPSKIANGIISWATGVALHDYGCTLKAYRRDVSNDMQLYGEMHRFLPALAHWNGARVTEIPVNHRPRKTGKSKYGFGRVQRVLLDLITVKFLLSYSTKPMQVFGKYGFYTFGLGVAMGLLTLALKFVPPYDDVTDNPFMYMSIFFMLGGLQLIAMGLLGEINVRTYYESQAKSIYSVREALDVEREPVASDVP